jgi:hypothetical protein
MTVYVILFVAIGAPILVGSIVTAVAHPSTDAFEGILVPAAILMIFGTIVWTGRWSRDDHEGQLVAHLRRTLHST